MKLGERRGWIIRDYVMLLALVSASIWFARDAWLDMFNRAMVNPEHGQALFAPLIAAYLFWLRRSRLQFLRFRPSLGGTLVIAGSIFLLYLGSERNLLSLWHLAAVLLLVGCVITMTGFEVVRQFAPVIICLFFLVPTPGSVRMLLAAPLQDLATAGAISVLDLTNVNAVHDGVVMQIGYPPKNVVIGEAYNGMRIIFGLFLVVYGFAFSAPYRIETRLLLLASCPIVALLCNVIRMVPTSLVYGHGSHEFADAFHWYSGFIMLPMALLMVIGLVSLLNWLDVPTMKWRLVPQ